MSHHRLIPATIVGVLAVVLVGTAAPLTGSTGETLTRPVIVIRVYDTFGVPVADITAARTSAGAILWAAGIETIWIDCWFVDGRLPDSASRCGAGVSPNEVLVRILASSGPDIPRARAPLGESLIDLEARTGLLATVFADRVASLAGRAGVNPGGLLGRVIAHEIGHLLIGTSHATHGLMRAVWTDQELQHGASDDWQFSTSEARHMQAGIVARLQSGLPGLVSAMGRADPASPARQDDHVFRKSIEDWLKFRSRPRL